MDQILRSGMENASSVLMLMKAATVAKAARNASPIVQRSGSASPVQSELIHTRPRRRRGFSY
jgi:hypothetical protein